MLTRRIGEIIDLPDIPAEIIITGIDFNRKTVSLGIKAPQDIKIHRREVLKRIQEGEPFPRPDRSQQMDDRENHSLYG